MLRWLITFLGENNEESNDCSDCKRSVSVERWLYSPRHARPRIYAGPPVGDVCSRDGIWIYYLSQFVIGLRIASTV